MYLQWLWSAWSARKMLQWQNSGSTKHIAISYGNFTWIFQIHFGFFYLKLPIVLLYTMNSYQNLYVSFCGMHHLVHNNLVFFAVLPSIFDYLLSFQTGCNYHFLFVTSPSTIVLDLDNQGTKAVPDKTSVSMLSQIFSDKPKEVIEEAVRRANGNVGLAAEGVSGRWIIP